MEILMITGTLEMGRLSTTRASARSSIVAVLTHVAGCTSLQLHVLDEMLKRFFFIQTLLGKQFVCVIIHGWTQILSLVVRRTRLEKTKNCLMCLSSSSAHEVCRSWNRKRALDGRDARTFFLFTFTQVV